MKCVSLTSAYVVRRSSITRVANVLVDPPRRDPAAVAVDEAGRTITLERSQQPPHLRSESPSSTLASAMLSRPSATFASIRARCCSSVVIVIVVSISGD